MAFLKYKKMKMKNKYVFYAIQLNQKKWPELKYLCVKNSNNNYKYKNIIYK